MSSATGRVRNILSQKGWIGGLKHYVDRVFQYINLLWEFKHYSSDCDLDGLVDFCLNPKAELIAPIQLRSELLQLSSLVRDLQPKTILEIGTARGGTLFCLTRCADPSACVISLDLPKGPFGGGYSLNKVPLYKAFRLPSQKLHLLRANSHLDSSLEKVKSLLRDKPLDFLFLDGDHTYEGIKSDYEMYSPLVRKGGIIGMHDIASKRFAEGEEVRIFWEELKASGLSCTEIMEHPQKNLYGIGIVRV